MSSQLLARVHSLTPQNILLLSLRLATSSIWGHSSALSAWKMESVQVNPTLEDLVGFGATTALGSVVLSLLKLLFKEIGLRVFLRCYVRIRQTNRWVLWSLQSVVEGLVRRLGLTQVLTEWCLGRHDDFLTAGVMGYVWPNLTGEKALRVHAGTVPITVTFNLFVRLLDLLNLFWAYTRGLFLGRSFCLRYFVGLASVVCLGSNVRLLMCRHHHHKGEGEGVNWDGHWMKLWLPFLYDSFLFNVLRGELRHCSSEWDGILSHISPQIDNIRRLERFTEPGVKKMYVVIRHC